MQDLFFTNGLVLCGELDVDLRLNIRYFFKYAKEIIRNSGVLGGEEGSVCEVFCKWDLIGGDDGAKG